MAKPIHFLLLFFFFFFLDTILIYVPGCREGDLIYERIGLQRIEGGTRQRRLRHWIVARRKISVLRINVSHKTNFWFTLEGIGEVVKRKKRRFAGARHLDASNGSLLFRVFPRPRFRIHDTKSISSRYIYTCSCNRYHGEDSVHLLQLTINFSRTRFPPVSCFLW